MPEGSYPHIKGACILKEQENKWLEHRHELRPDILLNRKPRHDQQGDWGDDSVVKGLSAQEWGPEFKSPGPTCKTDMAVHTCNPSTEKAEAGGAREFTSLEEKLIRLLRFREWPYLKKQGKGASAMACAFHKARRSESNPQNPNCWKRKFTPRICPPTSIYLLCPTPQSQ